MLLHAGVTLLAVAAAVAAASNPSDGAAVETVVRAAYVEGVHAHPDSAAMRKGFHPDFRMLVLKDGAMSAVTLEEWIARMEKFRAANPNAPLPKVEAKFTNVDVTGNAATVRLELSKDGKHVFTDYLALYRFADGWKIVSKTFQAHS
jgi:ketosteroid isomerase-like protein